jgi:hypothetical protein
MDCRGGQADSVTACLCPLLLRSLPWTAYRKLAGCVPRLAPFGLSVAALEDGSLARITAEH